MERQQGCVGKQKRMRTSDPFDLSCRRSRVTSPERPASLLKGAIAVVVFGQQSEVQPKKVILGHILLHPILPTLTKICLMTL